MAFLPVAAALARGQDRHHGKVNLAGEAARLTEFWSQRVIASGNGNLFKVAKGIGSTNWHTHEDQDEVFPLLEGHLTIQMRDTVTRIGPAVIAMANAPS